MVNEENNTLQHIILIVKYYIYKSRCTGKIPTNLGCKEYLKYCIKIEKLSAKYVSPAKQEYILQKWLPLETVLGN